MYTEELETITNLVIASTVIWVGITLLEDYQFLTTVLDIITR